MYRILLLSLVLVVVVKATGSAENPDSVIRHVKHQLSSAKLDIKAGRPDRAKDTLRDVVSVLNKWIDKIGYDDGDDDKINDTPIEEYVQVVQTYNFNQTYRPKQCNRVASEDGDYLKIQYVAWKIPQKSMFASSFHTGSMPVKVVLGNDVKDKISGISLSEGLRGACRGERRDVFVPASLVSDSATSDIKFSIEVVEIGKQKSSSSSRKNKIKHDL